MSWTAILGCARIVLVSLVAMIPDPRHRPHAPALLLVFPVLLVAIAVEWGLLWALLFFAGPLSIYRYRAMFLVKYLRPGLPGEGR